MSVFCTTAVQAQIQFGLKGGANVTSMSFNKDVLDASNRAGFFIGPTVKFTLPVVGLGIDASALYDQREAKMKVGDAESNTIKSQSINVPINLRYGIGLGSAASIFFFAGPQFGFNVGDKTQELYKDVADWNLKIVELQRQCRSRCDRGQSVKQRMGRSEGIRRTHQRMADCPRLLFLNNNN